MPSEIIQQWLKRKVTAHVVGSWLGAVLALSAGLIILFITFWFAYAVIFIGEGGISAIAELISNHKFHLAHGCRMVICGLFVAALFVEWMRRSPDELGNYGRINSPPGARGLVLYDGAFGAFAMLLANPQASASMITEILYIGPQLVLGAASLARNASAWQKFDFVHSAVALQLLATSGRAVTNEELYALQPDVDWSQVKLDLARIPGVVLLEKGVTLTEELRNEINAFVNPSSNFSSRDLLSVARKL